MFSCPGHRSVELALGSRGGRTGQDEAQVWGQNLPSPGLHLQLGGDRGEVQSSLFMSFLFLSLHWSRFEVMDIWSCDPIQDFRFVFFLVKQHKTKNETKTHTKKETKKQKTKKDCTGILACDHVSMQRVPGCTPLGLPAPATSPLDSSEHFPNLHGSWAFPFPFPP